MSAGSLTAILAALAASHAGPVFVGPDVAKSLVDSGATVLDSRGQKAWRAGHIASSSPIDWRDYRAGSGREGRLTDDLEALASALGALGVSTAKPVLVVGGGATGWGEEGRVYWMLDYLGHPDVRILDGGWPIWETAGLPTTTERVSAQPTTFAISPRPATRALLSQLTDASKRDVVFWDTREEREYLGATPYREQRGGHIPGARHLWFRDLMTDAGRLKNRGELRALLQARGIPLDAEIIAYCTGGVRSGFAYAVLKELGSQQAANYDGSMWEWSTEPTLPLETH